MISAFVNRRPWVAALVGLLLGPFVGMLYLGRGVWVLAYAGVWVAVYGVPLCLAHFGLLPFEAETAILGLVIAYRLGGALHCGGAARDLGGAVPAAWFARWYVVVLIGIVLPVGPRMVIWEPFNLPASSMEPTLLRGDYFIVEKAPYLLGTPQRGDLVVFLHPADETAYVKRLVGLPGDTVQMQAGSLYLNGERVPRRKVEDPAGADQVGEIYRETLPSRRSYLVREFSDEMRLDNTDVFEVPPDHYFFLGDNRDNSLDSRVDVGMVPSENLIGRVIAILWNREAQRFRLVVPE
jgi:signal peptidase I